MAIEATRRAFRFSNIKTPYGTLACPVEVTGDSTTKICFDQPTNHFRPRCSAATTAPKALRPF